MSIRTKNILTVLLPVLILGGFIFLAEGLKNNDKDDRLEAIERATTTTVQVTTTTRPPSTTTTASTVVSTTTTAAAIAPPTTVRAVTPTTRRPTTATTSRTTATTRRTTTTAGSFAAVPRNGAGTENSDNTGSFSRNADGSFTGSASPACSASDPFCFYLSSTSANPFTATIRNNTNRTISFPGDATGSGLKVFIRLNGPKGTQEFVLDATSEKTLASKAGLLVRSSAQFTDVGQYTFVASANVDYGQ